MLDVHAKYRHYGADALTAQGVSDLREAKEQNQILQQQLSTTKEELVSKIVEVKILTDIHEKLMLSLREEATNKKQTSEMGVMTDATNATPTIVNKALECQYYSKVHPR